MGRGNKAKIRKEANIFVGFVGFLTIAFIIYGCFAKYLRLELVGLLAGLISAGNDGEEAEFFHSVLTVAQTALGVGEFIGTSWAKLGTGFLVFILFATVGFVPLAQCTCVLILWFVPVTAKRRSHLITAIEILKAWQYLEVYFLGTLIMMWQAGPITTTLTFSVCGGLRNFFASLAAFGVLTEQNARCFLINASLDISVIFHISAGVLLWWLTRFVSDAVEQQGLDMNIKYGVHFVKKESDNFLGEGDENEKDFNKIISDLVNLPIRFTDAYPWAMQDQVERRNSLDNGKRTFPVIDTSEESDYNYT